jgi:hypothetical protein
MKNVVNVPTFIKEKAEKLFKKLLFVVSGRSVTKIAGSGSISHPRIQIRIHPKMSWILNTTGTFTASNPEL